MAGLTASSCVRNYAWLPPSFPLASYPHMPPRSHGAPTTSGDDLLALDILDGVLASLRSDACEPRSAAAQPRGLLPLPHMQLVFLLWHSLSRSTRGSFIAKTAAAICDAVEARPGARGVALIRLHALLHYSLRHFEQVPEHLSAQFQAYLVAAPGADGPTPAETFDAGRLSVSIYTYGRSGHFGSASRATVWLPPTEA